MEVLDFGCGLLFLLAVSIVTLFWIIYRRPINLPPGPPVIPIIGNFYCLSLGDFLQGMRNLRRRYGDIFSLSLGSYWIVVVNGNDNLHELLVKRGQVTSDRPPLYLFKMAKNKGVGSSSGATWKHHRTFMLTTLRTLKSGQRSFESIITAELRLFLSLLESYKGQSFDLDGIIQTSMSNVAMTITIGHRFDYDDLKFKSFVHILKELNCSAFSGPLNFFPLLGKLPGDLFEARRLERCASHLFDFFRDEIKEHRETLCENNIRDFIDAYLLEIKAQMKEQIYTEDELLSLVVADLFSAGTDTTATVIRWTFMYLLNNPDVQNKMRKEIYSVVGCRRLPSISDKRHLPYCEAVVLESLRLGNIAPFSLPHYTSQEISYKGFKIPKNSVILPSLDSIAHDEDLFPDSNSFIPERFIDANGNVCGRNRIPTFSFGRRSCLGASLAKMELFLYLTSLIQNFEFLPPENEDPPPIKGTLQVTYSPVFFKMRAILQSTTNISEE